MYPVDFNFASREWVSIKSRLEKDLNDEIGKLCNPSCSHDEANQIRGRIRYIKEFLLQEQAALREKLKAS